ncbi:MAG: hypothetical protein INR73_28755 [Williamsia sp.]|nr:hypothetical protein [Williamsia sp.]
MGKPKKRKGSHKIQSGYLLGRHPATGVLHSLRLFPTGKLWIFRGPYVSVGLSRYDGQVISEYKELGNLESNQADQAWLIETIRKQCITSPLLEKSRRSAALSRRRRSRKRLKKPTVKPKPAPGQQLALL